jgi:hypothetical protein
LAKICSEPELVPNWFDHVETVPRTVPMGKVITWVSSVAEVWSKARRRPRPCTNISASASLRPMAGEGVVMSGFAATGFAATGFNSKSNQAAPLLSIFTNLRINNEILRVNNKGMLVTVNLYPNPTAPQIPDVS